MSEAQTRLRSSGNVRTKADVTRHGPVDQEMQAYLRDGEARALALPNRGPIRFDDAGRLAQDIVDSYYEYGFYVFKHVLSAEELADIEADVIDILDRLPVEQGSPVDAKGRPALAAGCQAPTLFWAKPLSDPFGGTDQAAGRHPVKMSEPEPPKDAPKEIVYLILGSLQFSEACLRVYAHPQLLKVAATINGDDFMPFTEAIFIKKPGQGASVAWHQDGVTHWDSPNWDPNCHGFNFMAQLYGCTAANAVWIVPGSHKLGRIDIGAKAAQARSDRLPDAVPMICDPGDVVISNRQCLHGSFANTSSDWRVTINFGFHRRASVLGVTSGGLHNARAHYDEERIRERSRLIGYAISARQQRFPKETPFIYKPHADAGEYFEWKPEMMSQLKDYNLLDMGI
ncbi:MAG: phytanoyl-CoA dioxygenase family protein [Betaproteobacteria bacterium]|nr:MAG: phytanoyl-CoA dioxygenase family protein [Betaproteobacteria bacterium]